MTTANVEGYTIRAVPTPYSKPAWHARWRRNDWPTEEWVTVDSASGFIVYASTGAALTAARDKAASHRSKHAFTEPKYPGDTVRIVRFVRHGGHEFGDVRVQDYMGAMKPGVGRYKVGTFLPGVTEWSQGDTPKIWPEKHIYVGTVEEADAVLAQYTLLALAESWQLLIPGKGNH
jgi:hypothetical protein